MGCRDLSRVAVIWRALPSTIHSASLCPHLSKYYSVSTILFAPPLHEIYEPYSNLLREKAQLHFLTLLQQGYQDMSDRQGRRNCSCMAYCGGGREVSYKTYLDHGKYRRIDEERRFADLREMYGRTEASPPPKKRKRRVRLVIITS